tara:strand:+ start:1807 stop:2235 length:429 start_codon:yes stop_codon:yes gene_type:complete
MKKQKTHEALSAGGVVWRRSGLTTEIVLGYVAKENRWGLPKGTTEEGETLVETALREVQEETGLLVELGEKIGVIEYWFTSNQKRFHKCVHHWLMQPAQGDFLNRDYEFDEVTWKPITEAYSLLTFETEKEILEKAEKMLEG